MNDMRIGITNQKGGVAKTTNTINVAGALAELGHDVIAVDADPQGYLTNRLGHNNAYTTNADSLFEALKEPRDYDIGRDLAVSHPEFDILPAHVDMFRAEQELIAAGWKPRERLSLLFDHGGIDDWDIAVVDAPPSLGPINDNVLLACEGILVPVETDEMMQLALEHLLNQIETLEQRYDTQIKERGILVSDVNYPLDNEQQRMLDWFEDTFGGRCPVFEIAHRVAIARSIKQGGSIFGEDAEDTDMTDVYLAVAEEVASHA
ncbi:ParA family protein [Halorussus marinus]|uniref:ParA family protein n=1 Tax=Halorussus marinus TaxID=2505976 RepID=UPI0010925725|nr:ParA family protein [Halorussus marinus]